MNGGSGDDGRAERGNESMHAFQRNVPLLAVGQAVLVSGMSLVIASSALVGAILAPHASWATLPLAVLYITMMATIFPAAEIMRRRGRRFGFRLAAGVGALGAGLAGTSIVQAHFAGFVVGIGLIGVFSAFGNYLRFTGADIVAPPDKGRAIAYILAGGVVAAFIGPGLAQVARDWIADAAFAGAYFSLVGFYVLAFVGFSLLALPPPVPTSSTPADAPRPLPIVAAQPRFRLALFAAMIGYGVMSLLMTATPLAMHAHQHSFDDIAFVIQWHVLGMFAPSFLTGRLIRRFGAIQIMLAGAMLGLACVALNLLGTHVGHFWLALVLLGISWNFLFIGATGLLTETYRAGEQARVQALNDFAVFSTVAVASLSAGVLHHAFGWQVVNIGVIPLLMFVVVSIARLPAAERRMVAKLPVESSIGRE